MSEPAELQPLIDVAGGAEALPEGLPSAGEDADRLMGRFLCGDAEAVAGVRATLQRVVRQRGYYIPVDDRPDIVQESLVDLVRSVPDASLRDEDEFLAFVRTIGHRRCVDWMRRRRRSNGLNPRAVDAVDPDDRLLARERSKLACEVVSRLRAPCRDLFALHVQGMTYGQLAEHYGRTEGALRTQAYECLKQARSLLDRLRRRATSRPLATRSDR